MNLEFIFDYSSFFIFQNKNANFKYLAILNFLILLIWLIQSVTIISNSVIILQTSGCF
jgi:hypothetical protein